MPSVISRLAAKLGNREKKKTEQSCGYPAAPLDKRIVMPAFGIRGNADVVLHNLPHCSEAAPAEEDEDGIVMFDLPYVRGRWNEAKGHWEAIEYADYEYTTE